MNIADAGLVCGSVGIGLAFTGIAGLGVAKPWTKNPQERRELLKYSVVPFLLGVVLYIIGHLVYVRY